MGSIFFHRKVSIALIVLVNQITTYALLLCHFLLFGYSRKDNIISKERRLIREREMSWQFVNLHPKMYFTKYCFIRNTYYIVLYIICISFECVLVIDWLLLHIPTRYRHWYRYTCLYELCISVFTKYDNAYAPRV